MVEELDHPLEPGVSQSMVHHSCASAEAPQGGAPPWRLMPLRNQCCAYSHPTKIAILTVAGNVVGPITRALMHRVWDSLRMENEQAFLQPAHVPLRLIRPAL